MQCAEAFSVRTPRSFGVKYLKSVRKLASRGKLKTSYSVSESKSSS